MRNKVIKKLLMIAMAVTMISGTSLATVYANANPPAEETTTEVVQETSTEITEDTEKKEDTGRVSGESNNSAFSTPGNAQLVDDKENDDTKQFLTIQTKKGNTFYMVIDRSSNTENVYMMHHKSRLATKPGITGMWQVSGRSDITDFEEVVRLDTEYIENWSFGLDLKIVLKTIKVVLGREGSK